MYKCMQNTITSYAQLAVILKLYADIDDSCHNLRIAFWNSADTADIGLS